MPHAGMYPRFFADSLLHGATVGANGPLHRIRTHDLLRFSRAQRGRYLLIRSTRKPRFRNSAGPRRSAVPSSNECKALNFVTQFFSLALTIYGTSKYTAVQARDMLNSTSADEQNFEMLQTLYQSCMEEETVSEAGTGPLIDLVMSLGVFWPVDLNDSTTLMNDSDSTSFATAITYLTTLEIPAFANLAIDEDLVYPDIATVSVGPNYNQTAYNVTQIASVLQSIGNSTGISDDVAEALAEGIADLQDALYTVAPDSSLDFPPFEAMNITEIADLIPNLGLAETIVTLSPDGYTADRILVKWPEYWGNVSSIVQSTPKSILYAWLAYQIVLGYGPYVQTSADDPTGSPRWKTCVESLSGLFYIGSRFWISAAFSQEAREVGDEMLLKIRSQFKTRIGQLTWMSDEVKALSMEKVDNGECVFGQVEPRSFIPSGILTRFPWQWSSSLVTPIPPQISRTQMLWLHTTSMRTSPMTTLPTWSH